MLIATGRDPEAREEFVRERVRNVRSCNELAVFCTYIQIGEPPKWPIFSWFAFKTGP